MEQIDQTYGMEERGDLLIFVSGIQEITVLAEELHLYASYTRYVAYSQTDLNVIRDGTNKIL
jgi:hypothetical protein